MSKNPRKWRINVLDPQSIDAGLKFLKDYERKEKIRIQKELPYRIGSLAQKTAESVYRGAAMVWYRVDNNGNVTVGANDEEICFIEFGAGVYAESEKNSLSPWAAKNLGFYVFPGSWSLQNKQTYQKWVAAGKPGEYKYNIQPLPGIDFAYNAILQNFEQIAKEVFL